MLSLVAVFLPSFLLVIGALSFWEAAIRSRAWAQTAAISVRQRALLLPFMWQTPPWLVVVLSAAMDRRWTSTRS